MTSPRIRGNKKPTITIGTPGAEYAAELLSYNIENDQADADTVTFEDAQNGGARAFFMRGSAIQSLASASFWRYVWENSGTEGIPYTVAPHGNAEPTESEPHFVGTLTLGAKPKLGGEASTSTTSAFTFDYEFPIDGEPVMDTGSGS